MRQNSAGQPSKVAYTWARKISNTWGWGATCSDIPQYIQHYISFVQTQHQNNGNQIFAIFAVLMAQGRASETGDKFKNSNIMYQILAATNWALKTTNHWEASPSTTGL